MYKTSISLFVAVLALLFCTSSVLAGSPEPLQSAPMQGPSLITLTADPQTITKGASTILIWSTTTGFKRLFIRPGVGQVGPSGSISVSPVRTTTYTLSDNACVGEGCKPFIRVSVTVTVTDP